MPLPDRVLAAERPALVERVVAALSFSRQRAAVRIECKLVLGAHNRDLDVPRAGPVVLEAVEYLGKARGLPAARDVAVQPLEGLADACPHERFHSLGVDLDV